MSRVCIGKGCGAEMEIVDVSDTYQHATCPACGRFERIAFTGEVIAHRRGLPPLTRQTHDMRGKPRPAPQAVQRD